MSSTDDTALAPWRRCSHTRLSGMTRLPQRAICLQSRQWRQERSCVKWGSSERMSQGASSWSTKKMAHEHGRRRNVRCCALSIFPILPSGEAYDLHPPPFCSSFPPGFRQQSRCFPCVLHLPVVHCWCTTGTGSTRRTRSVLCLPMLTLYEVSWIGGRSGSHILPSCDARHAVHGGPPHTTRRHHGQSVAGGTPARHAGAQSAMPRAGSSSEHQVRLESGQAETKASDGQGPR